MIGSSSSILGGKMPYSATKSGLVGIMSSINKNHSSYIRANLIVSGIFESGMIDDWTNEKLSIVSHNTYTKRPATVEEIAQAIIFCCSNGYLAGSTINLTNGQIK